MNKEVNRWNEEDWRKERERNLIQWEYFHTTFFKNRKVKPPPWFSPRTNIITYMRPFLNRKGRLKRPYDYDWHEVRLAGYPKLGEYHVLYFRDKRSGKSTHVIVYWDAGMHGNWMDYMARTYGPELEHKALCLLRGQDPEAARSGKFEKFLSLFRKHSG